MTMLTAQGLDRPVHDRLRRHDERGRQARHGLGEDRGARSLHRRQVDRCVRPRSIPSPPPGGEGRVRGGTIVALALLLASSASAQDRAIPFWPNAVPAAIHAEVDGVATLETVRELARFHRVQGSPGLRGRGRAHEAKALAAGLADAAIERFPADGKTKYAHFLSHVGWDPVSGAPRGGLADGAHRRLLSRTCRSRSPTTARTPTSRPSSSTWARARAPADYAGRDVRGQDRPRRRDASRPSTASPARSGARRASSRRSRTRRPPWSGDDRDLIRWGHLSPYQLQNRFAFMVSKRQAEEYRARLAAGEKIVLRARVEGEDGPGELRRRRGHDPGHRPLRRRDRPDGAPLPPVGRRQRQRLRAAPRSSRSAARSPRAVRRGTLPRPRRTIRFLWLPEITGSQAYLVRHPELVRRPRRRGPHGHGRRACSGRRRARFHLSRTAESLPHVVNAIAEAWFDQVVAASPTLRRGRRRARTPASSGRRGRARASSATSAAIEMGSDHEVFEAAGFRVPMVYFHDYPDVTIHTQKDLPENLDATKLGRVAYIGAGIVWTLAALPDAEAPRLLAVARASVEQQVLARGAAARARPGARRARGDGVRHRHARVARAALPGDRGGRREGRRAPARRHASRAARLRPPAAAEEPGHPRAAQRLLLRLLRGHPGRQPDRNRARGAAGRRGPRLRGHQSRRRHALGVRDPRRALGAVLPRRGCRRRRVLRPLWRRPASSRFR